MLLFLQLRLDQQLDLRLFPFLLAGRVFCSYETTREDSTKGNKSLAAIATRLLHFFNLPQPRVHLP